MANFLGIVRKAFPFISAAASVGGPIGTLAAGMVGKVLGVDTKSDPESIASAIAGATPDQMVALKQAELELQGKLAELGFKDSEELAQIAEADRENARARQIAVKDKLPSILAIGITLGFFGVLAVVLMRGVMPDSRDVADLMLGSLGTAWTGVMGYYFGSSAGSAAKTAIMAQTNPTTK